MDSSHSVHPQSFAVPESARVIHTELDLYVDFHKNVLKGTAILTIERKNSIVEIILDNYKLFIKKVKNFDTEEELNYKFQHQGHFTGGLLAIQLPEIKNDDFVLKKTQYKIQIDYETNKLSPALYWLSPAQTASGTHPFLLSNNKFIFARSVFPCQDTPSVKFTYSATITVPKDFTVLMPALLSESIYSTFNRYKFLQTHPVASYAVIIAVGSLQKRRINSQTNVFAENRFINEAVKTFHTDIIENMLKIAEHFCGPYCWERYDICVLPPCLGSFEIECPSVAFISPVLLNGDASSVSLLALSITQSWAGHSVTCANYNDFWLNKSFSMFICRKIISQILPLDKMQIFYRKLLCGGLNKMILGAILKREVNNTNSVDIELNPLIPNLLQALPINYIKYIPYDLGCELLNTLENKLGSSAFEAFFKFYFHHFAFKSITTDDWKSLLFKSFPENKKELESIEWNYWFYNIPTNLLVPHCKIAWETECLELVEGWATWDDNTYNVPPIIYKKQDFCNFEEIIFLDKLHSVYKQLTVKKIMLMSKIYFFETKSYQIRFLWLLLCIKVGWYDKILDSLQFVLLFCSSDHICTLFRDIMHVYPEYHSLLIITFEENKEKMLSYTQDKLKLILFQQN